MGSGDDQPLPGSSTVMTATVGRLSHICPDTGNFEVYLERFEMLVKANGVDEGKKIQVFLNGLGDMGYKKMLLWGACYSRRHQRMGS